MNKETFPYFRSNTLSYLSLLEKDVKICSKLEVIVYNSVVAFIHRKVG